MTNLLRYCEGAVGAGDFGEEVAEFGGIFSAWAGFDAAGDVDGVRANGEDSFADVFGREATGENDFVFCGGSLRDRPVERLARTAELVFFRSGIEEEIGRAAESFEIGHGKTGTDTNSLDDGQIVLDMVVMFWRFVAVKLHCHQLHRMREIEDHFRVPVDENADGLG